MSVWFEQKMTGNLIGYCAGLEHSDIGRAHRPDGSEYDAAKYWYNATEACNPDGTVRLVSETYARAKFAEWEAARDPYPHYYDCPLAEGDAIYKVKAAGGTIWTIRPCDSDCRDTKTSEDWAREHRSRISRDEAESRLAKWRAAEWPKYWWSDSPGCYLEQRGPAESIVVHSPGLREPATIPFCGDITERSHITPAEVAAIRASWPKPERTDTERLNWVIANRCGIGPAADLECWELNVKDRTFEGLDLLALIDAAMDAEEANGRED